MKSVGLDGYPGGWVAACIDGGDYSLAFLEHVAELNQFGQCRAMIDIPIGLPNSGNRGCDLEAKRILGPDGRRVFTGARRNFWDFRSREQAQPL